MGESLIFAVNSYMKVRIFFTLLFLAAPLSLLLLGSCEKSSGDKTAFEHPVLKPWFDQKCASCHGGGGSNRGNWLYDPADYEGSIKDNISRINQAVYTFRSMPPGGATQAELDRFKAWYDSGYPAR